MSHVEKTLIVKVRVNCIDVGDATDVLEDWLGDTPSIDVIEWKFVD